MYSHAPAAAAATAAIAPSARRRLEVPRPSAVAHHGWRVAVRAQERVPENFERRAHVGRTPVALVRLALKAPLNDGANAAWHCCRQRRQRLMENRRGRLQHRDAAEGPPARCHLVEHHAQRPDVAALVGHLAAQHFRRHVGERAGRRGVGHRFSRGFAGGGWRRPGQAEVQDLQPAARRHQYVGTLDVAVDDTPFVGMSQCIGDLRAVRGDGLRWQAARRDHRGERAPVDDLHDDEGAASWTS